MLGEGPLTFLRSWDWRLSRRQPHGVGRRFRGGRGRGRSRETGGCNAPAAEERNSAARRDEPASSVDGVGESRTAPEPSLPTALQR